MLFLKYIYDKLVGERACRRKYEESYLNPKNKTNKQTNEKQKKKKKETSKSIWWSWPIKGLHVGSSPWNASHFSISSACSDSALWDPAFAPSSWRVSSLLSSNLMLETMSPTCEWSFLVVPEVLVSSSDFPGESEVPNRLYCCWHRDKTVAVISKGTYVTWWK